MENYYAIYAYQFTEVNDSGDWTQGVQVKKPDMTKCQDFLYKLFGETNTEFRVQENNKEGAKIYDCKVYGKDDGIVVLRILNDKLQKYYQEVFNSDDSMGTIEKASLTSTPCTYVIIDCRPGYNIVAIKVETDAWRNTDTVCNLMELSINHHFESFSRGFRILFYTKMFKLEFYDFTKKMIYKEKRSIKSVKLKFGKGKIDPQVKTAVCRSKFMEELFSFIEKYGGISGEMTINNPIGQRLLDQRYRDIKFIIALIESNPSDYSMDIKFNDDFTLHCGQYTRFELPMEQEGAVVLFHSKKKGDKQQKQLVLFDDPKNTDDSKYLLELWLDKTAEECKFLKDEETIKSNRGRTNKRKTS